MWEWAQNQAVSDNIVHLAALLYLSGFLFRNQVLLRLLIVVGDLVYMLYFYFAPAQPLWGGIFWSAMFTLVNLTIVGQIVMDMVNFNLTVNQRKLFRLLEDLTPGDFRKLLKVGKFEEAPARKLLSFENKPLDKLYFVINGNLSVEKRGRRALTGSRTFIGEDAFLLSRPAAATVFAEPGAVYFVWHVKPLRQLLERQPALKTALGHVLNRNLAHKLIRASVLTDTVVMAPREPAGRTTRTGPGAASPPPGNRRHRLPPQSA